MTDEPTRETDKPIAPQLSDQPYFSELRLRCGKCGYKWRDWQPNNCRVEVLVAAINALTCPMCGADSASLFMTGEIEVEVEAVKDERPGFVA